MLADEPNRSAPNDKRVSKAKREARRGQWLPHCAVCDQAVILAVYQAERLPPTG